MTISRIQTQPVSKASSRRWERIGAAGGIFFVLLQLAGQMLIQIGGSEPAFNASSSVILDYFLHRNLPLAMLGGYLSILSIIPFLWFMGVLWAALQRREGNAAWLSLVAFASGVTGMAILLSSSGWELALLRLGEGQSAETVQFLFDQGNLSFASLWVALASMLFAAGIVTIRDGALPRWLGWFGLITALALLAARAVWFTASGIKFLPYTLVWVWLIAASIALMRPSAANDDA